MTPLTDDTLNQIAWYCAQASPGPVQVMQVPDSDDPIDWVTDALLYGVQQTAYGVALGTPEEIMEGGARMTAFTGNGPTSLANANFYMLCHSAVPILIAEIRRVWAAQEGAE